LKDTHILYPTCVVLIRVELYCWLQESRKSAGWSKSLTMDGRKERSRSSRSCFGTRQTPS